MRFFECFDGQPGGQQCRDTGAARADAFFDHELLVGAQPSVARSPKSRFAASTGKFGEISAGQARDVGGRILATQRVVPIAMCSKRPCPGQASSSAATAIICEPPASNTSRAGLDGAHGDAGRQRLHRVADPAHDRGRVPSAIATDQAAGVERSACDG